MFNFAFGGIGCISQEGPTRHEFGQDVQQGPADAETSQNNIDDEAKPWHTDDDSLMVGWTPEGSERL